MNLKKQLKLYLDHRGISASELARISGVPKQSLSDWLAGSSPRNIQMVKKVADALAVSVDHLVFGEGMDPRPVPLPEPVPSDDWVAGVYEVRFRKVKE